MQEIEGELAAAIASGNNQSIEIWRGAVQHLTSTMNAEPENPYNVWPEMPSPWNLSNQHSSPGHIPAAE